jgi:hypothetical protein
MKFFFEEWSAAYGSPYQIDEESHDEGPAMLVEDGPRIVPHAGSAGARFDGAVAFVDGVRRGEASVYQEDDEGNIFAGIVGAHACGAVLVNWTDPPTFAETTVTRLALWQSDQPGVLPVINGGWSWKSDRCKTMPPHSPLEDLQRRMREEEARVAESLCSDSYTTFIDGSIPYPLLGARPIIGYVKTHHRRLLDVDNHRLVPKLRAGERTSLFMLGHNRYSAYVRLTPRSPYAGPWAGIIRIEIARFGGLEEIARLADRVASVIPRFAGVSHRDPRAPQNLQPIGALETHLRHLLGDQGLAARAVRDAVAHLSTASN